VLPAILAGAGIVGLGIGSYFGLSAISKASDANDLCPDGRCTEQRGETLMEDARDSANISNVAFGVGAAALATGLILYFTNPSGETASGVGVLPVIDTNSAGLAIEGRL
jgi:serine/threonine-protein kinase